eukprot:1213387-Amphidinium_carterae.2
MRRRAKNDAAGPVSHNKPCTIVSVVGQNGKPQVSAWNSSKQKGIVGKSSSKPELITMPSSYDISGGPVKGPVWFSHATSDPGK